MNQTRWLLGGTAALSLAVLAACGGGGGGGAGPGGGGTGTLQLSMTDAPACGYDAVNVTVERIRAHQASGAGDDDGGWSEIVLVPPRRLDLLALTNGVLASLGATPVPAGRYTQLRLVLAPNRPGNPFANSVVPSATGTEVPLTTPSATRSGLKLAADIEVPAGRTADFVLDFDACRSIVTTGAGSYLLKPVVQVIPRASNGVAGAVEAAAANGNTAISLQRDGVVVRSTVPRPDGSFLLQPVAPGTYTLVMSAPDRTTAVVRSVTVAPDAVLTLNTPAAPFTLPASPSGTLAGTVTTPTSPVDATVRALQALTGGPTVEIVSRPADGVSGGYSFRVPVAAPRVATYAPGGALSFAPDGTAAGRYGVQAISGGTAKTTQLPSALAAGGSATTDFTFP